MIEYCTKFFHKTHSDGSSGGTKNRSVAYELEAGDDPWESEREGSGSHGHGHKGGRGGAGLEGELEGEGLLAGVPRRREAARLLVDLLVSVARGRGGAQRI